MGKLLLAGTGHAHLNIIRAIPDFVARGHSVTAVAPGDLHYYSGMGAGLLAGTYEAAEVAFPVREMVEKTGGTFIKDRVVSIDARRRVVVTASRRELSYDVVSCNLGSFVPMDIVHGEASGIFAVKPIENLSAARKAIVDMARERVVRVGICGGGPSAVEMAGNAWALGRQEQCRGCSVQIFTDGEILEHMPGNVRRSARRCLDGRGIQIVAGSRVRAVETGMVHLENGRSYAQDIILSALGVRPSTVFARSNLPLGPDGGLSVNEFQQCPTHPEIFGGGDCIHFEPQPLDKVGVHAVRQGPVLLHNTLAMLEGRPLRAFHPQRSYLLIFNVGDGRGILHRNGIAFTGRAAWWIKDAIDRRFMQAFQAQHGKS